MKCFLDARPAQSRCVTAERGMINTNFGSSADYFCYSNLKVLFFLILQMSNELSLEHIEGRSEESPCRDISLPGGVTGVTRAPPGTAGWKGAGG